MGVMGQAWSEDKLLIQVLDKYYISCHHFPSEVNALEVYWCLVPN